MERMVKCQLYLILLHLMILTTGCSSNSQIKSSPDPTSPDQATQTIQSLKQVPSSTLLPSQTATKPSTADLPTATPSALPISQGQAKLVSQIGGESRALASHGNLIYLGSGPRLLVIDVSEPANPHKVGESQILGDSTIRAIEISAGHAYVSTGTGGLWVLDLSDPLHPAISAHLDMPGEIQGMAVEGDFVYLADGFGEFHILDASQAQAPQLIGSIPVEGIPRNVFIADGYAYLAVDDQHNQTGGLLVVDVRDPASPRRASFRFTRNGLAVAVVESHAFFFNYQGLLVYDVSNPENPKDLAYLPNPFDSFYDDMAVMGDLVYLKGDFCQLGRCFEGYNLANVGDPQNLYFHFFDSPPTIDRSAMTRGRAFVVRDGLIFQARPYGLEIRPAADPMEGKLIGSFQTLGRVTETALAGDLLFVVDTHRNLHILNVSDRVQPQVLGFLVIPPASSCSRCYTTAVDLVAAGDQAYYWDILEDELWVIDARDPAQPRAAGHHVLGEGLWGGIASAGHLVYVAGGHYEGFSLEVVDVSSPARPRQVSYTEMTGPRGTGPLEIVAAKSKVYVTLNDCNEIACFGSLTALDVSDPGAQLYARSIPVPGARHVTVDDDFLYVAGSACLGCPPSLHVITAKNSTDLVEVSVLAGTGRVFIAEGRTYAQAHAGLQVLDLSDPSWPHVVGVFPSIENVAAVAGGYAIIAGEEAGLFIYELEADF